MRTFSGMLARLRQKALRFPCVDPEPSPRLSPALESLASQKRSVLYVAPSSEWDAKVPDNRAKAAAFHWLAAAMCSSRQRAAGG